MNTSLKGKASQVKIPVSPHTWHMKCSLIRRRMQVGHGASPEPVKWEFPNLTSRVSFKVCSTVILTTSFYTHSEAKTVVWRVILLCAHTENQRAGHYSWEDARFPD